MGSAVKSVTSSLFGGREDSGIFGTGQFRAQDYKIDKQAVTGADVGSNLEVNEYAQRQRNLANALEAASRGEGPSIAQDQLKQATDRTMAQAQAQAQSGRGMNAAMAARAAMQAQGQAGQEAAGQSAQLRAQEQVQARGELQQAITNARSQAQDMAASDRDARLALEQLEVNKITGQNTANQAAYADAANRRGNLIGGIGAGLASAFSDEDTKIEVGPEAPSVGGKDKRSFADRLKDGLKAATASDSDQPKSGHHQAGEAMGKGLGAAFKAISDSSVKDEIAAQSSDVPQTSTSTGAKDDKSGEMVAMAMKVLPHVMEAMSDEKSKTPAKSDSEVKEPAKRDIREFLEAIGAHKYQYKPEFKDMAGEGTYVSPMAQELEKSDLGEDMVIDTPKGKVVDYGKGFGTIVAAQADMHDRLKEIEKALKLKNKRS